MASSTRRRDAGASKRRIGFEGLRHELSQVVRAKGAIETEAPAELKREVVAILRTDYGQALRRCLSRPEVREIANEGKNRVWPSLNQEPVRLVSPNEFVRQWSAFGVDFKFASLAWKEGLSLLGFYVKKIERVRNRPLIFINTAHHPAQVGIALDHEMGHHLTSRIFGAEQNTHLLSLTGFEEHLVQPAELAADTLVSLAFIPAPKARAIFTSGDQLLAGDRSSEQSDPDFAKLLAYVANRYGFRFEQIRGINKRLRALATLVHYAKLRRALLDEYNT